MTEFSWRSREALGLPFDQYQRYATAARVVHKLGGARDRTVLDVGGAPGFLELFFPGARVAVADRYGTHGGNFVVADGARLPFADASFDVVLTLDTLEHISADDRHAFLDECRRVTRDLLVLSAPHATDGVELAEEALQAFVTARLGETFATLQEHADNGLPSAIQTYERLNDDDWNVARLPSGYLPRWLLGMIIHHELLATGLPELPELHRFYNERQSPLDNAEPAYRQVFIASRTHDQAALDAVVDELLTPGDTPRALQTLATLGAHVLGSRIGDDESLVHARQDADDLRDRLAAAEREIVDRDAHIAELRLQLNDAIHRIDVHRCEPASAPSLPSRLISAARVRAGRILKREP